MQNWQIVISRLVNAELLHSSFVCFVSVWKSRNFASEQHFRKSTIVTQLCVLCCVNNESEYLVSLWHSLLFPFDRKYVQKWGNGNIIKQFSSKTWRRIKAADLKSSIYKTLIFTLAFKCSANLPQVLVWNWVNRPPKPTIWQQSAAINHNYDKWNCCCSNSNRLSRANRFHMRARVSIPASIPAFPLTPVLFDRVRGILR